ncbi:MAG: NFACT family protein, partial [bacterium]|nr:NFACT family protein [bacterium]
MYLSYFILRKLVEDLRNSLVGKPIKRCALAPPHELYLDLDGASLLLSASPATGRVALCNFPREGLSDPPAWAERNLLKSTVESVELADLERIFSLVVTRRDRLGGQIRYRLICEVMGRHSNIILISEPQNRILGALRQVGGRMNRERQILPGKPYLPPPPLERIHPEKTTPSELFPFFKKEPDTLPNTLMHAVAGLDPISSAEVLHRASISTFADVSPETLERLCTELKSL